MMMPSRINHIIVLREIYVLSCVVESSGNE